MKTFVLQKMLPLPQLSIAFWLYNLEVHVTSKESFNYKR